MLDQCLALSMAKKDNSYSLILENTNVSLKYFNISENHQEVCLSSKFEFFDDRRVSEALVKKQKQKLLSTVNILHNKTMAKSFTITQMKELLDTHENTVINIFTNRTENLESRISNIQDESKVR